MGTYLSTPKTEKFSEDGENGKVKYGLSSMQGWRATMEDAHAALPDLDNSTSFFGVYHGHGEQMSRIVNELYSIHFSIKKASQLVKEIGRQVNL
ncbi:hypothetical protein L2E82_31460 [Cichorium intybus]|uniref:Uncharacterized protein n=1 Tax=Cichorium intybus TaxID=13427 RepID=A0ACB9D383_CICIN|nr:hypothetical protein L2E82_31460 [Cichorium intybus]